MAKKSRNHNKLLLPTLLVAAVLVIAAGITIALVHRHDLHSPQTVSTTSSKTSLSNTKDEANTNTQSSGTSSSTDTDKNPQPTPVPGAAPAEPIGDFVSNHTVSLSESSEYTTEQSVCNTTVGATCIIEFTMNGVTRQISSISAETVGSSGAVYWTWDVTTSGLTQGTWTVSAVASLNGQSVTSQSSTTTLNITQ